MLDFKRILSEIHRYNPDAILVLEGTMGDDIPYAINHLRETIKEIEQI